MHSLLSEDQESSFEEKPPKNNDFYGTLSRDNITWAARYAGGGGLNPSDFFSYNDIKKGRLTHNENNVRLHNLLAYPQISMHDASFYRVSPSDSENELTREALRILFTFPPGFSSKDIERKTGEIQLQIGHDAIAQNAALSSLYKHNGHNVVMVLAQPGAKDGVFLTDSGKVVQKFEFTDDGEVEMDSVRVVIPVYAHIERGPEATWRRELEMNTTRHNPREVRVNKHIGEMGDTRFVGHRIDEKHPGGFILAGIKQEQGDGVHPRSTLEGHRELERNLDIKVHTIYLKRPFYHMDTTGILRTDGKFFTNRDCFMEESWLLLLELFGEENIVEMPMEDMKAFLGNGTAFGHKIYTSDKISDGSAKKLAEGGYEVYLTPISALMLSGGGHRCMTSWHHYFTEGGYIVEPPAHGGPGKIFRLEIDYSLPNIAYSSPIIERPETNFPFTLREYQNGQPVAEYKLPGCGANLNIKPMPER